MSAVERGPKPQQADQRLRVAAVADHAVEVEECHLFIATNLYEEQADPGENERIEIVEVPLSDLDSVIRDCRDSKTLVGLLWLRASLNR